MKILGRLALLFVVVPIVELMLLIELGQVIGLLPTLALVMFTGVTGAWLARAEGTRVFFQFQKELALARLPGQPLLDGISVLIGGAFLLTPGVITDVLGFSLLLPYTRRWIQRRVRASLERQIDSGAIRVVSMGGMSGGFGAAGFSGFGDPEAQTADDGGVELGGPMRPTRTTGSNGGREMDPSKGIVVEPED